MLQRVTIDGVNMPRLYMAENYEDVELAKRNGIPYVRWKWGMEELLKSLLRPTLEKMFPYICWTKVLGRKRAVRSKVVMVGGSNLELPACTVEYDADEMLKSQLEYDDVVDKLDHDHAEANEDGEYGRDVDIALDYRDCSGCSGGGYDTFVEDSMSIADYVGDLSSSVDIDALQKLGLLPQFVGDVANCIKLNMANSMRWNEGYTKKLGYPLGNFNNAKCLPNLIILDISWSIPDGIAATMMTLIDTLRSQCNAELIITSARSGYYPIGAELPKPQTIRDYYGRSNESYEFNAILERYIAGREFGHVISFGDNDNPGHFGCKVTEDLHLENTKVHEVHHYHTCDKCQTGYARWVGECCPNVTMHFDTDWCKVMRK